MTTYLTTSQVRVIHDLESAMPARDPALLDTAVNAIRATWDGRLLIPDVHDQAAALLAGISQAQSFVDGNKRTSWIATDVFLSLNGLRIDDAPTPELVDLIEGLSDGRHDQQDVAAWLRTHTRPAI